MMVKAAGILLVVTAGYLCSEYAVSSMREHLRLLEEGEYLFRLLESEIRNAKIPLPDLLARLGERSETRWKDFFGGLSGELYEGSEEELSAAFSRHLRGTMDDELSEEERYIFFSAGRMLLSDDMVFRKENAEQVSDRLRQVIRNNREQMKTKAKVYRTFFLSVSALIVIVLI